jgi:hypothetical protein
MYESIPPKGSHLQLQWHGRHSRSFDRHPPPIKVEGAAQLSCNASQIVVRITTTFPLALPYLSQHLVTANEMYGISTKFIPYAVNFECLSYELSNLTPPPILRLLRFPLIQSIVRHRGHAHAISHRFHTP